MSKWDKLREKIGTCRDTSDAFGGAYQYVLNVMDRLDREEGEARPHSERQDRDRSTVSYYAEADVLYITLPDNDETAVTHDLNHGILVREKDGRCVGITIVDVSMLLHREEATAGSEQEIFSGGLSSWTG